MDPYLEDPALWPDVHHELISVARELLLAALRPKYFVQIDERLYVEDEFDPSRSLIIPDLRVREVNPQATLATRSGIAVEPGIEIDSKLQAEVRESRLIVIDREQNRAVTVVEILSPANKLKGSAGHASYNEKKQELLGSETNLVEIDLLRTGVPLVVHPRFDPFEYLTQVWRWTGERHRRWVWPMRLAERLKPIPVPVRLGDTDAALDLQVVLNTAYDRAGYDLRVNYIGEPVVPLSPESAAWARQVIASRPAES
jgi:hypothetical protein